ncbi:MAG: glycosyl hydrolase 115 family protein [Pyrinomonadaceae bacterium]|nr:glycosyl hydrolase 115 family protein [Pyrinomonadaceae bacterium]
MKNEIFVGAMACPRPSRNFAQRGRPQGIAPTIVLFFVFLSTISAQNFSIVSAKKTADIVISNNDFKVVKIAAEALANDIQLISDKRPKIINEFAKDSIIIGTLGKNELIEKLIQEKKLDVSTIQNKRECFLITKAADNFVIVGSDRRGTAYGVFELSKRLGVSPWVWWADVLPEKRKTLSISAKNIFGKEPSVKYRGIFLNDEDWGLNPWAAKTFEPEIGNIGPKTYAKIFELLLRLKANTCWSAMHEVTKPFNFIGGNAQTADHYAIIMGSSHAEPMLRNNVGEWKDDKEKYNFVSNEKGVTEYWEERAKSNGKFENIYTLGMRGIHDSPIQGTKNQAERIPVLEKIIQTQRNLLTKYVNSDIEKVPQIFCPYKEVLADYRAGLKVPEDVTIVFPDDNFGYIRYFPNASEQRRKGGFGVYYHLSYLGRPLSYLWLETTPPALIFEEMPKAYNNGMRDFWMLNVGDIKPAEIGIDFFMQMAYDAEKWTINNQNQFLKDWATREFGEKDADEIADIMDKYYRLGFQRKPEHLQWYLPKETPRKSDLNETEILQRLKDYTNLRKRAEAVYAKISPVKKDAFYELVLYPVRSAQLTNERFFAAELATYYKEHFWVEAASWANRSVVANNEINSETDYFNNKIQDGKWRFIMSPEMGEGQWKSMRSTPPNISLADFETLSPNYTKAPNKQINIQNKGIISIEAEHFTKQNEVNGFSWQVIKGLGKTGDSVTVFPQKAKTFSNDAPSLEYKFNVSDSDDFEANFYLIPTQPLVPGNGLRFAVSIDNEEPQTIAVDKDAEVSSTKWSYNILNQITIGKTKFNLTKGTHSLKIFAVDTGVILDKIVLHSGELPVSYFGPPETKSFEAKK